MNLPEIQKAHEAYLQKKIRGPSLQNNLRASSFGTTCDRYHYYSLTEYKKPHDIGLQSIFDEGHLHEKDVEVKLREIGFEVEGRQREFRFENPLITAHIDGMVRIPDGEWFPYDAKSAASWSWDKLHSAEDFINSAKSFERNYPAQILLYMLVTGAPYGCLVLKNKQTGRLKDIWFSFDEHVSLLDEAIKRAERVYKAHAAKRPPERTDDRSLCVKCDFKEVCLPDLLANGGVDFINNEDLAAKLNRRRELQESRDEWEDLDKEIKDVVKLTGTGEKACGDFLITIKERKQMRKVPLTWKEEPNIFNVVTITPIRG